MRTDSYSKKYWYGPTVIWDFFFQRRRRKGGGLGLGDKGFFSNTLFLIVSSPWLPQPRWLLKATKPELEEGTGLRLEGCLVCDNY